MEKIPEGTLVVVADGEGARVFRNVGDEQNIRLKQEDLLELMNANDEGPAGSSPTEQTGKQQDEATFSKQIAHRLNEGALKNLYMHLVLIADPQSLGRIRPLLHKETQQRLLGEVAKTLTNAPVEQIEQALQHAKA